MRRGWESSLRKVFKSTAAMCTSCNSIRRTDDGDVRSLIGGERSKRDFNFKKKLWWWWWCHWLGTLTWISKSTFSPWSILVCSSLTTAAFAERLFFICHDHLLKVGRKVCLCFFNVFVFLFVFLLSLSNVKSPEYALHLEAIRMREEVDALRHHRRDRNLWSVVLPCTLHLSSFCNL